MPQIRCEYLPWDSEFFGLRIGRVTITRDQADVLERAPKWARDEKLDILYLLLPGSATAMVHEAERLGFRLMDVRVTLEAKPRPATQPIEARDYAPGDLEELKRIARDVFAETRFSADPNFSRTDVARLYETWITRSCEENYAAKVIVAGNPGHPAGFVTLNLDAPNSRGQIALIGVAAEARGTGVGRALVAAAMNWFAAQNITTVFVVTQGQNIAAQRLYQAHGFRTSDISLWFHRWFTREERS